MLQREHSAILLTFIKLPFLIKIIVLSIIEWPFYTGFTVLQNLSFAGVVIGSLGVNIVAVYFFQLSTDVSELKKIIEEEKALCSNLVDRVKILTAQLTLS